MGMCNGDECIGRTFSSTFRRSDGPSARAYRRGPRMCARTRRAPVRSLRRFLRRRSPLVVVVLGRSQVKSVRASIPPRPRPRLGLSGVTP